MKWMLFVLVMMGCGEPSEAAAPTSAAETPLEGLADAVFAGGCFWCMEAPFEKRSGVVSVESGYIGRPEVGPSYYQVARGETGHFEAVRVVYDPASISFEELLATFWHNVDPTQANGQFCDRGDQYRTAIFVDGDEQRKVATASKKATEATLKRTVVTPILPKQTFWVAEEYHQDFYKKNPTRYKSYRAGCGRDHRLQQLWGRDAGR
jgi:peptide-methionine (S)-S-oxide reductase